MNVRDLIEELKEMDPDAEVHFSYNYGDYWRTIASGCSGNQLDGNRSLPFDRDDLGRMVREAWVRWARTRPNPKPSWLIPYEELDETDKDADRQIGECVARWVLTGDAARAAIAAMPANAEEERMQSQMLKDFDDPTFERDLEQIKNIDRHMAKIRELTAELKVYRAECERLRGELERARGLLTLTLHTDGASDNMEGLNSARELIFEELRRLGYEPIGEPCSKDELKKGSAQYRLRDKTEAPKSFEEVTAAVLEALIIQGGFIVRNGDGVGCVAQIIWAQHERAQAAQAEVARLREALEKIADLVNSVESDPINDAIYIADQALKQKDAADAR